MGKFQAQCQAARVLAQLLIQPADLSPQHGILHPVTDPYHTVTLFLSLPKPIAFSCPETQNTAHH